MEKTAKSPKLLCSATVYRGHWSYGRGTCGSTAKGFNAAGEPRCGVHSDEAKARRKEKSAANWKDFADRTHQESVRREATQQLIKLLPTIIATLPDDEFRDQLVKIQGDLK